MNKRMRNSGRVFVLFVVAPLLISACADSGRVISGDLAFGQFIGRLTIAIVGAGVSWGAFAIHPALGIGVAILFDLFLCPLGYELFALYPKSQSVGPSEALPW